MILRGVNGKTDSFMNRPPNLAPGSSCLTIIVLIIGLMGCGMAKGRSSKPLTGSRPNIILVLTDDQGMGDLSCMGNKILRTPHIDRLYREATRFTDFQVSPTC